MFLSNEPVSNESLKNQSRVMFFLSFFPFGVMTVIYASAHERTAWITMMIFALLCFSFGVGLHILRRRREGSIPPTYDNAVPYDNTIAYVDM